jgi:polysaccharide biosynthesis/export protein
MGTLGGRTSARICTLAVGLLGACSSVDNINDQAMLLESAKAAHDAARLPSLPFVRLDPTEYRIGPRDLLEISIYELEAPSETKRIRVRVSHTGSVVLPLIGSIQSVGLTASGLQASIEARLAKDFIYNPSVSVLIAEFKARRVTVLGEVNDPGTFELKENSTTLVHVLALAGSPTKEAGSKAFLLRAAPATHAGRLPGSIPAETPAETPAKPGTEPDTKTGRRLGLELGRKLDESLVQIDLTDLIENGNMALNCVLQDGDLIHIPKASMCFVTGLVHYPGGFPLRGDVTLLKAIALAGGARANATPELTVLLRLTDKGRESIPIDLARVEAGTSGDVLMQPGDVLVLSQSTSSKVGSGFLAFFRGLFSIGYAVR